MGLYTSDKIRNSHEIDFDNASGGADISTLTASNALFVVDGCAVVYNLNGTGLTDLFALFAADTAMAAGLSGINALVLVAAADNDLNRSGNDLNLLAGTYLCTNAAADTQMGLYTGYAVFNADCAAGTCLCTVTDTEAAVIALGIAGVQTLGSRAGLNTTVIMFHGHVGSFTAAGHICNFRDNSLLLKAHDFGDLVTNSTAAGHAEGGTGNFAIGQCGFIAIAASISSGTAVGAGKTFADADECLIFRNSHKL